ncbi:MAG: DUF1565 domain-containing protein [candidate division Zixibacteria bacterium]|nr:DUF1565 domain-containing protein [candidate division Zixibacteria bacterium]
MYKFALVFVGIISMAAISWADAGYALQFDGFDDFADCGNSPEFEPVNSLTLEAWFIPDDHSLTNSIISKTGHQLNPYGLYINSDSNTINFVLTTIETGHSEIAVDIGPYLGGWNHVAGVYDGSSMKLLINGAPVDSLPTMGSLNYYEGGELYIGADDDNEDGIPDLVWHNLLDEIKIWNTARTPQEIQSTLHFPQNDDETGLIGYWKFDTGDGDTAYDSSVNDNHAQLGDSIGADESDPAWIISTAPIYDYRTSWYIAIGGDDIHGDGSPENPFETIQRGIEISRDNDTVIVAPGTYSGEGNRDLTTSGKTILIKSSLGPESTLIDGVSTYSAFRFESMDVPTFIIEGISIVNCPIGIWGKFFQAGGDGMLMLIDCAFSDNDEAVNWPDANGSISFYECRFTSNNTGFFQNGFLSSLVDRNVLDRTRTVDFYGCEFQNNSIAYGDSGYVNHTVQTMDSCSFEENLTVLDGSCSVSNSYINKCSTVFLMNNRLDFAEVTGTRIDSSTTRIAFIRGGMGEYGEAGLKLDNCILQNNSGGIIVDSHSNFYLYDCIYNNNSESVSLSSYGINSDVFVISECTFIENDSTTIQIGLDQYHPPMRIDISNNIIAYNEGVGIYVEGVVDDSVDFIACNDIFENRGDDYDGIPNQNGVNGNFSLDPAFCDYIGGDFNLAANSPCAQDNNSCETLIGARDIACSGLREFGLIYPPNDSVIIDSPPRFIWQCAEDIDSGFAAIYTLYVDDDSLFTSPDSFTAILDTIFTPPDSLARSRSYYWHVLAGNDYEPSVASNDTSNFYLDGYPGMPSIISPENGDHIDTLTYLIWLTSIDPDSSDIITYTVQVDNDSLFGSPEISQAGIPSGLVLDEALAIMFGSLNGIENLAIDMLYFWRVRADDDYGLSSFWPDSSHYFIFLSQNHPPQAPISGFSPSDGEEVISLSPLITWNDAVDPDPDDASDSLYYDFYLYEDTLTGLYEYYDTTDQGANQVTILDTLPDNARFFYKIRTMDDEGLISQWSAVQEFWTNHYNYPPEPFPLVGPLDNVRRVDCITYFTWANTVDYDPFAGFEFALQYSPDSLFESDIISIDVATDTSIAIATNTLTLAAWDLYWRILAIDDDSLITIGGLPEPEIRELYIVRSGDTNGDGLLIGSDVTYLVSYFRGINPPSDPPFSGDVNGDCQLIGSDVTYMINYFRGIGASPIRGCCDQPPALSTSPKTQIID